MKKPKQLTPLSKLCLNELKEPEAAATRSRQSESDSSAATASLQNNEVTRILDSLNSRLCVLEEGFGRRLETDEPVVNAASSTEENLEPQRTLLQRLENRVSTLEGFKDSAEASSSTTGKSRIVSRPASHLNKADWRHKHSAS